MTQRRKVKRRFNARKIAEIRTATIFSVVILVAAFIVHLLTGGFKETKEAVEADTKQSETEALVWETEEYQKLLQVTGNVTVMVDPGHGGEDPGTITADGSIYEKDITWDVALEVEKYLSEAGVNVVKSRQGDTFINKHGRAELANEQAVDLFVSIHCNYLENDTKTSGIETYHVEGAEDGEALANAVHKQALMATGADDMYVRTNDFIVIKETNMPAVLIEIGYLSSPEDIALLSTKDYKKKMAYGIAAGVIEYINSQE